MSTGDRYAGTISHDEMDDYCDVRPLWLSPDLCVCGTVSSEPHFPLLSGPFNGNSRVRSAAGLIERAVTQVGMLAQTSGLTLIQQAPLDLPSFSGDEDILRRTLVNLLGNAIKFTPSGGTITASAEMVDQGMLFAIRDTGEGIPPEAFERIFEQFGQVESRIAGRKMSTGLGLTFCKLAVNVHGGRLWLESQPGKGSIFYFTIPHEE